MHFHGHLCVRHLLLTSLALFWLAGCQTSPKPEPVGESAPPPTFPADAYADADGAYRLDPKASRIHIHAFRAGRLRSAGHNHLIAVGDFQGALIAADNPADGRFDIVVALEDLVVDPQGPREKTGGNFAKSVPEKDRQGTRENMLNKVLDAGTHPMLGLRSAAIAGDWPKLVLTTLVNLNGVEREVTVPVTALRENGRITVRGSFVVKQTDFGIQPFSALGGALQVADPIMIEFELVGIAE